MKKLFYLTILDDTDRVKVGILNKINGQISAMKKSNIDVYFGHIHNQNEFIIENKGSNILVVKCNGTNTRGRMAKIYPTIKDLIVQYRIELLYVRYISLDGKALQFYKDLHKAGTKVIIEFFSHNLFLEHYKTAQRNIRTGNILLGINGFASLAIDRFYCGKLHECVDRIVTTTKSDPIVGIETINVTNGINIEKIKCRERRYNGYDFTIMSVAMISPWHGYDRVIKGISDYYNNGGSQNILYYIIGDGEERQNLEALMVECKLEKHVKFEGIRVANELDSYYDDADVALEMLAGFRRTKGPISSIKMAEYLAKGIPVVYTDTGNAYPDEIKEYGYLVPNDESNIDIAEMIKKIKQVYKTNSNVENTLRNIVVTSFTWEVTMKELLHYIEEV